MAQTAKYYDLHINVIGYLNRVRVINPEQGESYLCVGLTAIHGRADKVKKVYFDCIVSGEKAKEVITDLKDQIEDSQTSVLVTARLGDLEPKIFRYTQDSDYHKAGDPGVTLKSRLLKLKLVFVNGESYDLGEAETDAAEPRPQAAAMDETQEMLAPVVYLKKEDPDFDDCRARLKSQGYRWNGQNGCWMLDVVSTACIISN